MIALPWSHSEGGLDERLVTQARSLWNDTLIQAERFYGGYEASCFVLGKLKHPAAVVVAQLSLVEDVLIHPLHGERAFWIAQHASRGFGFSSPGSRGHFTLNSHYRSLRHKEIEFFFLSPAAFPSRANPLTSLLPIPDRLLQLFHPVSFYVASDLPAMIQTVFGHFRPTYPTPEVAGDASVNPAIPATSSSCQPPGEQEQDDKPTMKSPSLRRGTFTGIDWASIRPFETKAVHISNATGAPYPFDTAPTLEPTDSEASLSCYSPNPNGNCMPFSTKTYIPPPFPAFLESQKRTQPLEFANPACLGQNLHKDTDYPRSPRSIDTPKHAPSPPKRFLGSGTVARPELSGTHQGVLSSTSPSATKTQMLIDLDPIPENIKPSLQVSEVISDDLSLIIPANPAHVATPSPMDADDLTKFFSSIEVKREMPKESLGPASFKPPSSASKKVHIHPSIFSRKPLAIKWANDPIFEDRREEDTAYRISGRSNATFFQFGLRYQPSMSVSNLFRTVLISNIPGDTDLRLKDILKDVRGGPLASAYLLDTSNIAAEQVIGDIWDPPVIQKPGTNTALVQFQDEMHASRFEQHCAEYPLHFGGIKADVQLIETPTYPHSNELEIALQDGATRCLLIENPPVADNIYEKLNHDLRPMPGMVYSPVVDAVPEIDNGHIFSLEVHFNSVMAAARAMKKLPWQRDWKESNIEFWHDPCDRDFDVNEK